MMQEKAELRGLTLIPRALIFLTYKTTLVYLGLVLFEERLK